MAVIGPVSKRVAFTLTVFVVAISGQVALPQSVFSVTAAEPNLETVRLLPRHDAEVIAARPNLNLGSRRTLRAKSAPHRVSFIKFKVSKDIDPIISATLRLSVSAKADTRVVVRRAGKRWRESTVTYNTAPRIGGRLGTIDIAAGGRRRVTLDVSQYVDGPGIHSFAIVGSDEDTAFLRSSEAAAPPRLVLRTEAPPPNGIVMVAAGDIACSPTNADFNDGAGTSTHCRQRYTSDIAVAINPDVVAALGDLQYGRGELTNFAQSFDPSWGRLFGRTYPAAGNHEYYTADAAGYFAYWGGRAGNPDKGYYSYDVGSWHAVVLNTNCGTPDVDCSAGGAQAAWLRADLAASGAECTIAYGHHPRFSSGHHGDTKHLNDLYNILYQNGVDIYLAGHEHSYERTAPLAPDATVGDQGIRNFIVGTGGASLRRDTIYPRNFTEAWDDHTFGVLRLDLRPGSYEWEFINDGSGSFTDTGGALCG
jgi:hypothetical protein